MAKLWGISLVCGTMYVMYDLVFLVQLLVVAYLVRFLVIFEMSCGLHPQLFGASH